MRNTTQRFIAAGGPLPLILVAALGILGCATTSAPEGAVLVAALPSEPSPAQEPMPEPPEPSPEVPPLPPRTVSLLVEQVSRLPDGSVDRTVSTRYDPDLDVPVSEQHVSGTGEVLETVVFRYEQGRLVTRESVDGTGKLVASRRYTYTDAGLATETLLDALGTPQTRTEYRYDSQGRLVTWVGIGPGGESLGTVDYRYVDGRLAEAQSRSPAGVVEAKTSYVYDTAGKLITETTTAATGGVEREIRRAYENGFLVEERTVASGSLRRVVTYENDGLGNAVLITTHDGTGRLRDIQELRYELRQR